MPTEDTTLKNMRQVHYPTGGAEICAHYLGYDFFNFQSCDFSGMVFLRIKGIETFFCR